MRKSPDQIYGPLFRAVQLGGVFPDSKTFVDCVPKDDPVTILGAFERSQPDSAAELRSFVEQYFDIPIPGSTEFSGDPSRPVRTHIEMLWNVLKRDADNDIPGSSLLPLPKPYIVPGGRFGEIYYWDSYFTMLGLAVSGHYDLIESMLDNFAYLVETLGYIPNGNRTYFLGRSQPPFFCLMVLLLMGYNPERKPLAKYLKALEREYHFWMNADGGRAVTMNDGIILNRYWDQLDTPRPESYREDVELAEQSARPANELFRDIRAACESGWDFSSRWFGDPQNLESIETTRIIPVDLNCLLHVLETVLQKSYESENRYDEAKKMKSRAGQRRKAITDMLWNHNRGVFCDYHIDRQEHTKVDSMAMLYPLFTEIASSDQAAGVARRIGSAFLKPGGLITTLNETGQQWDAPNGWAPLQWIAFRGLRNYGFDDLARECAIQWVDNCKRVYLNTGKFVEKYNVVDMTLKAGGGEYPVQDGFGWTNGVMLKLLDELQNDR